MDFKGKIIAFDLDGTLTESNQKMEGDMAEVLETLLSKNKVAVITGAALGQMQKQMDALLSYKKFQDDLKARKNLYLLPISGLSIYKFTENGIEDISDQKTAFENPKEIIQALEEIIDSKRFGIPEKGAGEFIQQRSSNQISFSGLGVHASLEEKRAWDPTHEKRQEIKKELEAKIPNIEVSIGGNSTIDILPKGWNKAKGLSNLLKILNLSKRDIVFFGDAIFPGGNDYSVAQAGIESVKVSGPTETAEIIKKNF